MTAAPDYQLLPGQVFWEPVHVLNLTEEFERYIANSDRFDSGRTTLGQIRFQALAELCEIWVYIDDVARGVVVLKVRQLDDGSKELFVWRIGGKGMLVRFEAIDDLLVDLARERGCQSMRAYLQNDLYDRASERLRVQGWSAISTEIRREI
jgi:hypothetical protein